MSWNCDGASFETEEEAREHAWETMDEFDLCMYLSHFLGYQDLLNWCLKQDKFFETFEDEFCQAEEEYFSDNYWEENEDEEE